VLEENWALTNVLFCWPTDSEVFLLPPLFTDRNSRILNTGLSWARNRCPAAIFHSLKGIAKL
jgi:hypothetical protein